MSDPDRHDERPLLRLLAASQAEPDGAPLHRALARLAARDSGEPAWFEWIAKPIALASACALLVMSVSASFWMLRPELPTADATDGVELIAGMLGEDGSMGLSVPEPSASGIVQDSGGVQ